MSIEPLKRALAEDLKANVLGIGSVDCARIDPDSVPRALGQRVTVALPYWALSLASFEDTPGGFGSGRVSLFRTYQLRLEGWSGITGADEHTTAWENLVEAIGDRLEACAPAIAPAIDTGSQGLGRI